MHIYIYIYIHIPIVYLYVRICKWVEMSIHVFISMYPWRRYMKLGIGIYQQVDVYKWIDRYLSICHIRIRVQIQLIIKPHTSKGIQMCTYSHMYICNTYIHIYIHIYIYIYTYTCISLQYIHRYVLLNIRTDKGTNNSHAHLLMSLYGTCAYIYT